MNFLYTTARLNQFNIDFKKSTSTIMKKYTMHNLNDIARDIELATGAKFSRYARDEDGCKQIISQIQRLIKSWTPSDKRKIRTLAEQAPSKKKKREPKKEPKNSNTTTFGSKRYRR